MFSGRDLSEGRDKFELGWALKKTDWYSTVTVCKVTP